MFDWSNFSNNQKPANPFGSFFNNQSTLPQGSLFSPVSQPVTPTQLLGTKQNVVTSKPAQQTAAKIQTGIQQMQNAAPLAQPLTAPQPPQVQPLQAAQPIPQPIAAPAPAPAAAAPQANMQASADNPLATTDQNAGARRFLQSIGYSQTQIENVLRNLTDQSFLQALNSGQWGDDIRKAVNNAANQYQAPPEGQDVGVDFAKILAMYTKDNNSQLNAGALSIPNLESSLGRALTKAEIEQLSLAQKTYTEYQANLAREKELEGQYTTEYDKLIAAENARQAQQTAYDRTLFGQMGTLYGGSGTSGYFTEMSARNNEILSGLEAQKQNAIRAAQSALNAGQIELADKYHNQAQAIETQAMNQRIAHQNEVNAANAQKYAQLKAEHEARYQNVGSNIFDYNTGKFIQAPQDATTDQQNYEYYQKQQIAAGAKPLDFLQWKQSNSAAAGRPFIIGQTVDEYGVKSNVYGIADPTAPNGFKQLQANELANYGIADTTVQPTGNTEGISTSIEAAPIDPKVYSQYGLLATTDFNKDNKIDEKAQLFLDRYIKNANFPTPYELGLGRSATASARYQEIYDRANDLFFKATGQSLPDVTVLKGNKALIVGNNKLLNNLGVQEGTVAANFKLALDNMGNNVNNNKPIINKFLNPILVALGDPDVQTYLVSNTTLQNEAASLIAVKNASGTTVYDKMEAAGLVPKDATVEQQKAIVKRLEQEAENARRVILEQNGELYRQIDPLEQSSQNPNRQQKLDILNNQIDLTKLPPLNKSYQSLDALIAENSAYRDYVVQQAMLGKDELTILRDLENIGFTQGNGGTPTAMRTDRHNNPTAMTAAVAKDLGLVEGKDYTTANSAKLNSQFGKGLVTAQLLGDPVQTTIKGLDTAAKTGRGAFYTSSGKQRWSHTVMSDKQWLSLSPEQKKEVIRKMYQEHEGGSKLLSRFA